MSFVFSSSRPSPRHERAAGLQQRQLRRRRQQVQHVEDRHHVVAAGCVGARVGRAAHTVARVRQPAGHALRHGDLAGHRVDADDLAPAPTPAPAGCRTGRGRSPRRARGRAVARGRRSAAAGRGGAGPARGAARPAARRRRGPAPEPGARRRGRTAAASGMAQSPARDDRTLARRGRARRAAGRREDYRAWGHARGAGARRPPASRMHAAGPATGNRRRASIHQRSAAIVMRSLVARSAAPAYTAKAAIPSGVAALAPLAAFELPGYTRHAPPTGSRIGRSHD